MSSLNRPFPSAEQIARLEAFIASRPPALPDNADIGGFSDVAGMLGSEEMASEAFAWHGLNRNANMSAGQFREWFDATATRGE